MGNFCCVVRDKDHKFDKMLQTLRAEGSKFKDKDFPPDRSSLVEDWNAPSEDVDISQWEKYEWLRAAEIPCLS